MVDRKRSHGSFLKDWRWIWGYRAIISFIAAVLIWEIIGLEVSAEIPYNRFGFPNTWNAIRVIADQLPTYMTDGQAQLAGTHYAGSQKLTVPITNRLRQFNPKLLVLHYHLGIWQQNPAHQFIIDGWHWGNDWNEVTLHEDWFWHNEQGERVRSAADGKYLMNLANLEFREYWKRSLLDQIRAGTYQGVFLDSSAVSLLHGEASQMDPRLFGTAARYRTFAELGGKTWSQVYEEFMRDLTQSLEVAGFATLPNIGAQFTTWDTTDYFTTASGAFVESAFMTRSTADWKQACERLLRLIATDRMVIFQPYLRNGDGDIAERIYYLACSLLLRGNYTYINYFYREPLSWYPEYQLNLGTPWSRVTRLVDLERNGLYYRRFTRGEVWVNPTGQAREVSFSSRRWKVVPEGGGPVPADGQSRGSLQYQRISRLSLAPWSGAVLLYQRP